MAAQFTDQFSARHDPDHRSTRGRGPLRNHKWRGLCASAFVPLNCPNSNSSLTMKYTLTFCIIVILARMPLHAQSPADVLVSQGRAFLAAHDLTNANARF